jgi:23S rRNA (pseudouridine1915-N3)-methyltransferase
VHIHLIFVGKTNFPEIDVGIRRYLERLRHYTTIEVRVVRAERLTPKVCGDMVKDVEGERILKLAGRHEHLVVWDQRGTQMDSEGFSHYLHRLKTQSVSDLWMAVGGPLGMAPKLLERANSVLSLSKMTLPHDLARLVILEQLYRAFTIMKGEPYHK